MEDEDGDESGLDDVADADGRVELGDGAFDRVEVVDERRVSGAELGVAELDDGVELDDRVGLGDLVGEVTVAVGVAPVAEAEGTSEFAAVVPSGVQPLAAATVSTAAMQTTAVPMLFMVPPGVSGDPCALYDGRRPL